MASGSVIVALATAWGPKFGGINAFNAELVKSLGILPEHNYELICVVSGAVPPQLRTDCEQEFGVLRLLGLDGAEGAFAPGDAEVIVRRLKADDGRRFYWIGHDDKSGPIALELRKLVPGSRAVLINHMAHGAYQTVKKNNEADAAQKRDCQRELFGQADLCLAVGPMLLSHLKDSLATLKNPPPVEMLIPGLTGPAEFKISIPDAPPHNFVGFVAGRLELQDDRIKQGRLALRGFGRALHGLNDETMRSPSLRMRGIRPSEEEPLRRLLMLEAGRAVTTDFRDYTEDRESYFRDLASASVAMMPSWHEGFGLVAWEAIASAVPVVLSRESGVYRLLNDKHAGIGLGHCISVVHVEGWVPESEEEPNHTETDVDRVAEALLDLARRMPEAKRHARCLLDDLLGLELNWRSTTVALLEAIQNHFDDPSLIRALDKRPPSPAPVLADNTGAPEWLRLPTQRQWLQELNLPSSLLLAARDEIVRFDPERQPLLEQMKGWALQRETLVCRLVFGPGGIGKTRLAIELARTLKREGWLSLWLSVSSPEHWADEWIKFLSTVPETSALLVIDYADARPLDVLAALQQVLDYARSCNTPRRLRLLLVARSVQWLPNLAALPQCPQDVASWVASATAIEIIELPPGWSTDEAGRLAAFRRALEDYAAAMGRSAPANAHVPKLGDALFNRPLYLHLAALAALEGQRPIGATALLKDQLLREWRYWQRRHPGVVSDYGDWADAMAYVAFLQIATAGQLESALQTLGIVAPGLVTAMRASYPMKDGIASLEPDLIVEMLVRERLFHNRGAAILKLVFVTFAEQLERSLPFVARLVAGVAFTDSERPLWLKILIDCISESWQQHPNLWLRAAHNAEPGLGHVLFLAWQGMDKSVKADMVKVLELPEYSTNLLQLSVAVLRIKLEIASDSKRDSALNKLAIALANLGDAASHEEALECARETVKIRRELFQELPSTYRPALAGSLNNLANHLSTRGDAVSSREALECAREAVQLYRELARGQFSEYQSALAGSLGNLADRLSELGDAPARQEALECALEGVQLCRELVRAQPLTYRSALAGSLHTLAKNLSDQGDASSFQRTLEYARESVKIRRDLAEAQPSVHRQSLARSLTNLASYLSAHGDAASHQEALESAREAVQLYRELAQVHSSAYLPELAASLNSLAKSLSDQGDAASREEALKCAREAMKIRRELAESQPSTHRPGLALSLNNLATNLSDQGDAVSQQEAVECAREAVWLYRELAQTQPSVYRHALATSLSGLSKYLSNRGDTVSCQEALECAREALKIQRELASVRPLAYRPSVAGALNNLASRLSGKGDAASRHEALECAREAVQLYRELAQAQPSAYRHALAGVLNNLGNRLAEQGEAALRQEALNCAREAVKIRRELTQAQPSVHRPDLAIALNNLAKRLSETGEVALRREAMECVREAVQICRELVQEHPSAYQPSLAMSLHNMADRLLEQGEASTRQEALECAREAAGIYFSVYTVMPSAFEGRLRNAINTFAGVVVEMGGDAEGEITALFKILRDRP